MHESHHNAPTPEECAALLASPFLRDLCAELLRAEAHHAPLHSLHEAYAVIAEELDELWDQVRLKRDKRDAWMIRTELLQIAAMAWRTARDLGCEEGPHA
jgi:hypothetical protein